MSSNPGRNGGIIFFCRVNFVSCSYSESVPPRVPQWHIKDPGHSAKSAGGRSHLSTHTPLTQRSRSGLTMPLSRHSVGTYPETSSHTTRQKTLSHSGLSSLNHCGLILAEKSGISVRELISTLKKKKKAQAGNEWSNVVLKSSQARKKPPPPLP